MVKRISLIVLFTLLALLSNGHAQQYQSQIENERFEIKGSVYDKNSFEPYANVSVLVNGGKYTTTGLDGRFTVKVKIGDQLIIRHQDFETIYYTIQSNERLSIEVVGNSNSKNSSIYSQKQTRFNQMIDSAMAYLKKDAEKSIGFIGDALNTEINSGQSAEAHELLGDIYVHWRQFDLSISAYKISLQNKETGGAKLKLARAFFNTGDFDACSSIYSGITKKNLSNYEKVSFYEGRGDLATTLNDFENAISFYQDGLGLAKRYAITSKVTDLNSKIAQA